MRLHALSIYAAVGLTISTAAMPIGPPPCHDEAMMPPKTLPSPSLPPQKSYTEKPYLPNKPYAAPLSPLSAPKVENPKPEEKSYPPALAPKPSLEKPTLEKPYATTPLRKEEKPKPEEKLFSPAPALKPQEKSKQEEKPYAAPPSPPPSKEEVPKSEEKTCTLGMVPEPHLEKSKPASEEGKYKRQEKSFSPPPPPPSPPSQPYSEMTKSEAKPKPWVKTKLDEKPKSDAKSYPQKPPYLDDKGKSDKKQKPQDHFAKASDKPTPERLDGPGLSSQANSLVGSNSIGIPTDEHCLVNGDSTNGDECPKGLPYASYARRGRRDISTVDF